MHSFHGIFYVNFKYKRSPPEVFYTKAVLKNFAKFTGKYKGADLRPAI